MSPGQEKSRTQSCLKHSRPGSGSPLRLKTVLLLAAASQVLRQELLALLEEAHSVLGFGEAVAFVAEEQVDVVDSLVAHGRCPLLVAGVDELLAVPRRAPEVDLDRHVPPVGQPLGFGVEPPAVP